MTNTKYIYEKRALKIPNKMHLDACRQGSRIFRDKTKYTRKGKNRFDVRKECNE